MDAVLLAAGKGRRLLPLTATRPKPMIPFMNKPMIEYVMDSLVPLKVSKVVVLVDYLSNCIESFLGDDYKGITLEYIRQNEPYGTAGAVKRAVTKIDETFIVLSADVLSNINLQDLVEFHKSKKSKATMALCKVADPTQYGIAVIDENHVIKKFLEKPAQNNVFSDLVNAGIYLFEPEVFDLVPENKNVDFSKDLFPKMLSENRVIYGYTFRDYWNDIGRPSNYLFAIQDALSGAFKTEHVRFSGTKDEDEGILITGKRCYVHGSVIVKGFCIMGDNVSVGKNVELWRSVIWSNTTIRNGTKIVEGIIGEHVEIGSNVGLDSGSVVGDKCRIDDGCKIGQGIKIWPGSNIGPGTVMISD